MNLNATLLGQMITFAVFIWFTMKYVWPPITRAMEARVKKIADGLAEAERGCRALELAEHKAVDLLKKAKLEAAQLVQHANQRSAHIVEIAKEEARKESKRLIAAASTEIDQERQAANEALTRQIGSLAVAIASKIVKREVDAGTHQALLDSVLEVL